MPAARRNALSPEDLVAGLGPARRRWEKLLAALESPEITSREWKGEALRLKRKDRTILYLIPREDSFQAAFVLGDRAVAAARQVSLPEHVVAALNQARRYAEGTGLRFEVLGPGDYAAIRTLMSIKLAN
jgi:hypothetical protein